MNTDERASRDLLCLPPEGRGPFVSSRTWIVCSEPESIAIGVLGESDFCTDMVRDLQSEYKWVRVAMYWTPRGVEQWKA